MTENPAQPTTRRRLPVIIAIGIVVLIIAIVTVVLILAGGDKTKDGTGRDTQTSVSQTTNTTGGPAAGSDR